MTKLMLIFLAAGLGGVLRYQVGGWVQGLSTGPFPSGTLVVNVTGCLAIGFVSAAFAGPIAINEAYRVAIVVGLLGGFTTFSTFGYETVDLATSRAVLLAGLNLLLSNGMGLFAVWAGSSVAKHIYEG